MDLCISAVYMWYIYVVQDSCGSWRALELFCQISWPKKSWKINVIRQDLEIELVILKCRRN